MKTAVKGALATGVGATLLLGGAGSLAYWTDAATTAGVSISSGHLELGEGSCGSGWMLDGSTAYTNQLLVPGDELTKTCSFEASIAGTHFTTADFTVSSPSDVTGSAALIDELSVTSSVSLNGTAQASATNVAVKNGDKIVITTKVTWPYGSAADNGSNVASGLSAALDALTVTVKQNHNA